MKKGLRPRFLKILDFFIHQASLTLYIKLQIKLKAGITSINYLIFNALKLVNQANSITSCALAGFSGHGVSQVLLPQHPALPGADLRYHIGQKAQRIVRRQDGHTQKVSHSDQDEKVFHTGSCLHGLAGHIMGGHTINQLFGLAQKFTCQTSLWFFRHDN